MTPKSSGCVASAASLLLCIGMAPLALATNDALELPQQPGAPVVLASPDHDLGAPADRLQVFVGTEATCIGERVPMAGRYQRSPGVLTFTPAFGFVAGTDYVARIRTTEGQAEAVPFRMAPASAAPAAAVTNVFPSADVLPENTLRFYLHFSVPMAPHVAFDHIALRDASGAIDDAAFMRFKQELWNEDHTRLTVLIDPGRIKREVATNRARGPALQAGHTYQLTITGGWPSADGTSELTGFSRTFTVSPPLRERPDIDRWRATSPCRDTRDSLTLSFDRPFDRHRLGSSLRVVSARGQHVDGTIEVDACERVWHFTPDEPWTGGDVWVAVDPTLEDVAGNNFFDLLDAVATETAVASANTTFPVRLQGCEETP